MSLVLKTNYLSPSKHLWRLPLVKLNIFDALVVMLCTLYLCEPLHFVGESTVIDLTDIQCTDEPTTNFSNEKYSCLTGNQWLSDKVYNDSQPKQLNASSYRVISMFLNT